MNAVSATPRPAAQPLADDDLALVSQARGGRVAAFEQLYRRHHARIYAVCLRLHRHAADAEDALQETFILAWERLAEFRGDAAFGTWLYRIAVNTSLARLRSDTRRKRHLQAVDDRALENVAERVSEPGVRMDLDAAIATLPDGARTVLVMHDIEGYSHEEIAALTGIAAGTSKAQLHRARRLLRTRL